MLGVWARRASKYKKKIKKVGGRKKVFKRIRSLKIL